LALSSSARKATVAVLLEKWESEAKEEYAKWYSAEDETGRLYYCHRDTGDVMWEHPAEVLLPAHYMRIKSIQRLCDDGYVAEICPPVNTRASATPGTSLAFAKDDAQEVTASRELLLDLLQGGRYRISYGVTGEKLGDHWPADACSKLEQPNALESASWRSASTEACCFGDVDSDHSEGEPLDFRFDISGDDCASEVDSADFALAIRDGLDEWYESS